MKTIKQNKIMTPSLFPPLRPLQKSHKITDRERLMWLRAKFLKLPKPLQAKLFEHLKIDLQKFLTDLGYKTK